MSCNETNATCTCCVCWHVPVLHNRALHTEQQLCALTCLNARSCCATSVVLGVEGCFRLYCQQLSMQVGKQSMLQALESRVATLLSVQAAIGTIHMVL